MAGISLGGQKQGQFLERLALRLTGERRVASSVEGLDENDDEKVVYYLGGGYWRAVLREGRVYLINPSYQPQEIVLIEQAMELLLR